MASIAWPKPITTKKMPMNRATTVQVRSGQKSSTMPATRQMAPMA